MSTLAEAGLTRFPFRTVPPTEPTDVWVGRKGFNSVLKELVSSWSYRADSSIYLLWADFGAGKTHALHYLQHLAAQTIPPALAVYTDLPKVAGDFRGVYTQIIPQLPEEVLAEAINEFRGALKDGWLSSPLLRGDRDTPRVLTALAQLPTHQAGDAARKWLRGENCSPAELRLIDGVSKITTSDHATRTLATLCRLIVGYTPYKRVVLMLDEFQRIGQLPVKRIAEVNSGIHTWFNACPEGLSILLVYSIGVPDAIKHLVTPEVLSRVSRTYDLPGLTEAEAIEFVEELVGLSATDGLSSGILKRNAVAYTVNRLAADSGGRLTPRRLMLGFSTILEKALAEGCAFPVSEEYASRAYKTPPADTF